MTEPQPGAAGGDAGATGGDPGATLSTLADTLALDGYRLVVDVLDRPTDGGPGTVRLEVVATDGACEDCLVPEPIFAGIAGDKLGPSWTVEVRYPRDAH